MTANYWLSDTNAKSIQPLTLLQDATLMKVGNAADNVLWSLRWEIIFSLLLPLFVLAAILIRRSWIAFGTRDGRMRRPHHRRPGARRRVPSTCRCSSWER